MANKLIIIALLTFGFCFTANAQTDEAARRIQLIQALERSQTEVLVSRDLIAALKEQVASKESIIAAITEKDEASEAAIKTLQSEVEDLRIAIYEAQKVLELRHHEVEFLKSDLEKSNKKLSRSRRTSKVLLVLAGVLGVVAIVK